MLKDGTNQIISLSDTYGKSYWPYCEKQTRGDGVEVIYCELDEPPLRFRAMRERWWYIAVSRCNPTPGVSIAIVTNYVKYLIYQGYFKC